MSSLIDRLLVTVSQPFGNAYPLTLEGLVHKVNLNALSVITLKNTVFMEIRFLGFRMLVIVLELIAPDEFFTVYNK